MTPPPIRKKIKKIYVVGAATLLCFYALVFNLAILFTEDSANIKRLKIIGEHHFQYYKNGNTGPLKIDPLVTIYDTFESLPSLIKARIAPNWQGEQSYYFEDDLELNLFANQITTPAGITIVYAVERIDAIEIDDLDTGPTRRYYFCCWTHYICGDSRLYF